MMGQHKAVGLWGGSDGGLGGLPLPPQSGQVGVPHDPSRPHTLAALNY